MRYAKLSCTEFYSCYLQQCHSIDLFCYRTPGHGQKGHMNKDLLLRRFLGISSLVFSGTQHGVRGPGGAVYDVYFLKIMFCPQNGENRPSPGFFGCIGKFSFFSQFFTFLSIWSIMKVYITVIAVCLNKFHIRDNSVLWDMAQNAFGQSGLQDFSINFKTGCISQRN